MTENELFEEIVTVIVDNLQRPSRTITREMIREDSNFTEDLGFDSLDNVETIMEVEEHFSIEFTDEQAERVKTMNDLTLLTAGVIAQGGM